MLKYLKIIFLQQTETSQMTASRLEDQQMQVWIHYKFDDFKNAGSQRPNFYFNY